MTLGTPDARAQTDVVDSIVYTAVITNLLRAVWVEDGHPELAEYDSLWAITPRAHKPERKIAVFDLDTPLKKHQPRGTLFLDSELAQMVKNNPNVEQQLYKFSNKWYNLVWTLYMDDLDNGAPL